MGTVKCFEREVMMKEVYEKLDPWKILGLKKSQSSKNDIKRAYRRLAAKYHPDRNKSIEAEEMFKRVSWAYKKLLKGKTQDRNLGEDELVSYIVKNINKVYQFPRTIDYKDLEETNMMDMKDGVIETEVVVQNMDVLENIKLGRNIARKKDIKNISDRFELSGFIKMHQITRPFILLFLVLYVVTKDGELSELSPEASYSFDGDKYWELNY